MPGWSGSLIRGLGGVVALFIVASGTALGVTREVLLPFDDQVARCMSLRTGSTEQHECAAAAAADLQRKIASAEARGAPRARIDMLRSRYSWAQSLGLSRPDPPAFRRVALTSNDVMRTRRLLAADPMIRAVTDGQVPRIRLIGLYQAQSPPLRKDGAAVTLVWARPVTRNGVILAETGFCHTGAKRRLMRFDIRGLRSVELALNLRTGLIDQIHPGPEDGTDPGQATPSDPHPCPAP